MYTVKLSRLDKKGEATVYRGLTFSASVARVIQVCRMIATTYPALTTEKDQASLVFYLDGNPILLVEAFEE